MIISQSYSRTQPGINHHSRIYLFLFPPSWRFFQRRCSRRPDPQAGRVRHINRTLRSAVRELDFYLVLLTLWV